TGGGVRRREPNRVEGLLARELRRLAAEPLGVELVEELSEPGCDRLVRHHRDQLLHALGHPQVRRRPGPEPRGVILALYPWDDGVAQRAERGPLAVVELHPHGFSQLLPVTYIPLSSRSRPAGGMRAMIKRRFVIGAAGLAALGGG